MAVIEALGKKGKGINKKGINQNIRAYEWR